MKIVHVAIRFPPAKGGGEQHVYNLAKQQVKMGHEVHVITTDLTKEIPREFDRNLPSKDVLSGIKVMRMKAYPTFFPVWGYGSIFFGLRRALDGIKPDIVHTHSYGYFHSDKLARLKKKSKWKLVMTSHGFTPGRGVFRRVKNLYTKLIGKRTVKKLDGAIALSEKDRKVFKELGARNTFVIPNGLNLAMFENLPSGDVFRETYGIKGRMILSVGRLEKIKGYNLLIGAFSNIIKDFPDTILAIVGEDWGELASLKKLVEELNLDGKVIFTGNIPYEKIPEVYAAADIFVLSSLSEGLPTALLEAMACGIPIIGTDVGGVSESLGNCGILVKPDSAEILEALKKLFKDEDLRRRLSKCEKERIHRFDWRIIAKEALEVYEELLAKPKKENMGR